MTEVTSQILIVSLIKGEQANSCIQPITSNLNCVRELCSLEMITFPVLTAFVDTPTMY